MFFLAPQNILTKSNVFCDLVAEVGSITSCCLWNRNRAYTPMRRNFVPVKRVNHERKEKSWDQKCHWHISTSSFTNSCLGKENFALQKSAGGIVTEWLGRRTWNPEVAGSTPALTASCYWFTVDPSLTPRPRLLIAHWFASCQLRFLTLLCLLI